MMVPISLMLWTSPAAMVMRESVAVSIDVAMSLEMTARTDPLSGKLRFC